MTQSAFDPDSFLDQEIDGGLTTEYTPVPEMDDAVAMIRPEGGLTVRQVTNKETGKVSTILNIDWIVDEQDARDATGMNQPIARQSIFLDLNENGVLERGENKNVALGKLAEALGLNADDSQFTLRQMLGQVAKVRIKHRFGDADQIYAEVKGVKPVA